MKTHLNNLFDKLENEEGNKLDDKIKLEGDEELTKVIENYKKICKNNSSNPIVIRDHYEKESTRNVSAKTITKFSTLDINKLSNNEFFNYHVGYYISQLIHHSHDKKHEVFSLEEITYLGAKNREKEIQITGNPGTYSCFKMKSGKVTINGNAENCGYKLTGGTIIINGNCMENLGDFMKGGTIIVNGEIKSISNFTYGGNIYHRNKQIVRDGKALDRSYLPK